jgi:hypothetical protein
MRDMQIVALARIGVNMRGFPTNVGALSAFVFHGVLGVVLVLYFLFFWVLNMVWCCYYWYVGLTEHLFCFWLRCKR